MDPDIWLNLPRGISRRKKEKARLAKKKLGITQQKGKNEFKNEKYDGSSWHVCNLRSQL